MSASNNKKTQTPKDDGLINIDLDPTNDNAEQRAMKPFAPPPKSNEEIRQQIIAKHGLTMTPVYSKEEWQAKENQKAAGTKEEKKQ